LNVSIKINLIYINCAFEFLKMNKIEIYQHPFVDVFKVTRLTEWTSCHKEGDV